MNNKPENEMFGTCGCGNPVLYSVRLDDEGDVVYACNKYMRCPSYEELRQHNQNLVTAVTVYRRAFELTKRHFGEVNMPNKKGKPWFDADTLTADTLPIITDKDIQKMYDRKNNTDEQKEK